MGRGGGEDQLAAEKRDRGDLGRGARVRTERDVGPAVLQQVGEGAARGGLDRHLKPLVAGAERVDQRADVLGDRTRRGDLHPPRLARGIGHGTARLLGQPEDLGGQGGEPPPARSECDPPTLTDEQLVAELPAQRGHRDRDRGLGHLELRRGGLH
jgi:hypothetical protein